MHIKLSCCYSKVSAFFGPSTVIQNLIVKLRFKGKPRQKVQYLKLGSDSIGIIPTVFCCWATIIVAQSQSKVGNLDENLSSPHFLKTVLLCKSLSIALLN